MAPVALIWGNRQSGRLGAVAVYTVAVIVAGLQQLGVPFWAGNVVYGIAPAGGVGLSRHLTRTREDRARREQLRALKESRGKDAFEVEPA